MAKAKTTGCRECGGTMPSSQPTGRPAAYCSTACRRAAEYALRRVQGTVVRAEKALEKTELDLVLAQSWERAAVEKRRAFWAERLQSSRAELRGLLTARAEDDD